MAFLTKANTASLGHQGAEGGIVFHSAARPAPVAMALCLMVTVGAGWPAGHVGKLGAVQTAASASEGAAAVTPSALSTPTSVTLTPAAFTMALGLTSPSQHRALEAHNPADIAEDEIIYDCGMYLMSDGTVGLAKLFESLSNTSGNSGAALTVDGAINSANAVRSQVNHAGLVVPVLIDGKGMEDLQDDIVTNASAHLANAGLSDYVRKFITEDGVAAEDSGFWLNLDSKTPVFVEPGYDTLSQLGADRVGAAIIAPTENIRMTGLSFPEPQTTAKHRICPAFGIAVDDDPIAAARRAIRSEYITDVATPSGPVAVVMRDPVGVNALTIDGWGSATAVKLNDNSGCQCLYLV